MASVKGYLMVVGAVVLCPCHLPILAAIFAGTALGAIITEQYSLLVPALGLAFAALLFAGLRLMTSQGEVVCDSCPTTQDAPQPGLEPGDPQAASMIRRLGTK